MSIIAYKVEKNKVRVACDRRVIAGDEIVNENKIKIEKVPNKKIICGATGLSDSNDLWRLFVKENAETIKDITTTKGALHLAIEFKNMLVDEYHAGDDMFDNFGGFFFITPKYHCLINYDRDKAPFITQNDNEYGCFGATDTYTGALLDAGVDIVDAIKMTAKKFMTVNDNVYETSFTK